MCCQTLKKSHPLPFKFKKNQSIDQLSIFGRLLEVRNFHLILPLETDEEFLKNNPLLRDIWKPSGVLKDSMNASSIVLDLFELTQKNISSNGKL